MLKIVSIFLFCTLFLKIGVPTAIVAFNDDFWLVALTSLSGGLFGVVFYTYLSHTLIHWWHRYSIKHFKKKRKTFTKGNRRIIRVKNKFGLAGVAFVTPLFLTIPVAAFLCDKFYNNKRKVIIYLSVSVVVWDVILYVAFHYFHDSLTWLF